MALGFGVSVFLESLKKHLAVLIVVEIYSFIS